MVLDEFPFVTYDTIHSHNEERLGSYETYVDAMIKGDKHLKKYNSLLWRIINIKSQSFDDPLKVKCAIIEVLYLIDDQMIVENARGNQSE